MSGVDDKVELHLIDTRQLVEEARKIREAKKLAQDATKAKKDLAAGIGPLGAAPSQPTGAPIGAAKNKPKSFFDFLDLFLTLFWPSFDLFFDLLLSFSFDFFF